MGQKIHIFNFTYEKPEFEEEFKIITYPGVKPDKYLISTYGNVINRKNGKVMKTYFDSDYHEKITLVTDTKNPTKRGNKSKHYFIHRLMAWEFLGEPKDDLHNYVNHKNGIPCCNFIDNLEWCSILENTNHAKENKLLNNAGANCVSRKYPLKLIHKICDMLEDEYKASEIIEILISKGKIKESEIHKITQLIYKLKKKIIFHDIVSDYNYKSSLPLISNNNDINLIRKMIYQNKTNYDILNVFGYDELNDDSRKLYNKIIYQRSVCKLLFNDYRKDELEEAFGTE